MKTAVSIPDKVFQQTERLAVRMRKSRSEVYSLALAEYVRAYAPDQVTEAMDCVCAEVGRRATRSCPPQPDGSWSTTSGNLAGDVRWADLPEPTGSGLGFRRPVVVVQRRCAQPQSDRHCHLRAGDEQREMGQRPRKCLFSRLARRGCRRSLSPTSPSLSALTSHCLRTGRGSCPRRR